MILKKVGLSHFETSHENLSRLLIFTGQVHLNFTCMPFLSHVESLDSDFLLKRNIFVLGWYLGAPGFAYV